MADAEIDPSGIVGDVADAIGHRLAESGDFGIRSPSPSSSRPRNRAAWQEVPSIRWDAGLRDRCCPRQTTDTEDR
jgi:hypothetical protein